MNIPQSPPLGIGLAIVLALQGLALAAFGIQMMAWSAGIFSLFGAAALGLTAIVLLGWWPSARKLAAACAILGALAVGFFGLVVYVVGSCGSIVNCDGREPPYPLLAVVAMLVIADFAAAFLLLRRAPSKRR